MKPGGIVFAPASNKICQSPRFSLSDWTSLEAARKWLFFKYLIWIHLKHTIVLHLLLFSPWENRLLVTDHLHVNLHRKQYKLSENKYKFLQDSTWILIFFASISVTLDITLTWFGPDTCGLTVERSKVKILEYFAFLSAWITFLRLILKQNKKIWYSIPFRVFGFYWHWS